MRLLQRVYAEQRRMHGMDNFGAPSRFIAEIPDEVIEEVRPRIQVSRPAYQPGRNQPRGRSSAPVTRTRFADDGPGGLRLGQQVRHQKFGNGVVLNVEGHGSNARIQVNFERQGTKWLMMSYAKLEPV